MILISNLIIPIIILFIIFYGYIKKQNVYEQFLEGCIEGFRLIIQISPTIISMIFVIEVFIRSNFINIVFKGFHLFSPHLFSMALMRPISGNASLGIMQDIFKSVGPDSFTGFIASLLQGSTETTIYVVALYYGSVGIKKVKNTIKIGLIVDLLGILLAFLFGYLFYTWFMWYNFLRWNFMERLQKVIANSGYTSRRNAEQLIISGRVSVNGEIITELGVKVEPSDIILIDGVELTKDEKKVYYLLNKPRGYISSVKDEKGRKTITELIDTSLRIYPIGRLDYNTTGLIILTNDGDLANHLMHPKNNVKKTYLAKIEGILSKEDIIKLKKGIVIDDRKVDTSNFKVKRKDLDKNTSLVEITIIEGRNHIVKKIFSSLKHEVIKLTRTGYAFLDVNNLKSGEYRELSIKEVKKLFNE